MAESAKARKVDNHIDNNKLKLFEEKQVCHEWDEQNEKWWFSVVDICALLTNSDYQTARKYWKVLKGRLASEGNELVTSCYRLKLLTLDGKLRLTDVADTEQVLRLIQSIPSKKAEPFKMWLAKVGNERIDETIDPELSIDRALQNYRRLGYSENWISRSCLSYIYLIILPLSFACLRAVGEFIASHSHYATFLTSCHYLPIGFLCHKAEIYYFTQRQYGKIS